MKIRRSSILVALTIFIAACGGANEPNEAQRSALAQPIFPTNYDIVERTTAGLEVQRAAESDNHAHRKELSAYFGDLHVHTKYSFDAYAFGTVATPDDAYRFAKGKPLRHPAGFDMQLKKPLDFYAVTDHGFFLGVASVAADTTTNFSKYSFASIMHDLNEPGNTGIFNILDRVRAFGIGRTLAVAIVDGDLDLEEPLEITRSAWADSVRAADMHNDPGQFTTFVAYEYTSTTTEAGSLHRNVVFEGSDRVPEEPFSRMHSRNPEDLWDWMDTLRAAGVESVAIPHNSNKSNGDMFSLRDWAGNPLDDEYAVRRIRNEPLVEITQIKGTSETHPVLSSRDEWAGFELVSTRGGGMGNPRPSKVQGSYVREAWLNGLELAGQGITNPFAFGVIGSSDTHTAGTQYDEASFTSKLGVLSATADMRGSVPLGFIDSAVLNVLPGQSVAEVDGERFATSQQEFGASGLAGVWAEENTREAIYAAFRRKETFGTSGPRIRIRFFAGYGFPDNLLDTSDGVARAYADGVTMGADLSPDMADEKISADAAPKFAVWAQADADSAPLQRLQIIKGWIDVEGKTHERVIDVACAGGVAVDPRTNRCPDNGATVDLGDCSTSADTGASELRTVWTDTEFDANQRSFYYARVLENPTCRWNTWDALYAGTQPRSDLAATLQERAWSSPIQYHPADASAKDVMGD